MVLAAALSAIVIMAIRPLLMRYALARPNARSSHKLPTPQGAGIAVILATLGVAATIAALLGLALPLAVVTATLVIAVVGAVDDINPIPVLPRLLLQGLCAAAVLFALSGQPQILPMLPLWLERTLLFFGILWFVNLVNFMDGLDLITVAEVVPVTAGLVILGWLGALSPAALLAAAALMGAMIGFAPFNRPVAKVFLGDVGSLPIGLLLAWCLIDLAARHDLVAALLLPLYYLADATITLFRRLAKREPVWIAHRSHFYQRATDNGFSVWSVVSHVFVLNVSLAALAIGSATAGSSAIRIVLLLIGCGAVAVVLKRFSRRRPLKR